MQSLWYQNAVLYAVDVASFRDLDGDGWGDLAGGCERLDYLRGLGGSWRYGWGWAWPDSGWMRFRA